MYDTIVIGVLVLAASILILKSCIVIHYTVLARSNYNRTCQVMSLQVKKPSGEILKTLNSTLATTLAISLTTTLVTAFAITVKITLATTLLHLKTIHHRPFLIQLHQTIAVVKALSGVATLAVAETLVVKGGHAWLGSFLK